MTIDSKTRSAIEAAIRAHFRNTDIISIDMEEIEGAEGDALLKVTIVYETRSGLIDAKRASKLGVQLRPSLEEHDIMAFPIFSFISKAEAGRAGARR